MSGPGDAALVVAGPAPPLRGGIAAHTAGLVGHLLASGFDASALSWRRLYPSLLFPGRSQRLDVPAPDWSREVLDVLRPWAGRPEVRDAARGGATFVLQWWHPLAAPTLLGVTAGLPPSRLVAFCHNVLPHEAFPGAAALARAVLGRCGRVVCHSRREAERLRALLGPAAARVAVAPLPTLVAAAPLQAGVRLRPAEAEGRGGRFFVAAGHVRAYKGTEVLVEAWRSSRRPADAVLVLVGEWYLHGRRARRLREMAKRSGSIVLVDRYVEDEELVSWLTLAEAVVAPHLEASQSGLLPVAAALGVPVLVSDAGGLAEQAGSGAIVARAGDAGSLRVALERCFERACPVDLAARRAAASHSASQISGEWQAVLEAMGVAGRP